MKNFYTAREAMEKLGLKKSTFYDLIKRGDIPEGIVLPLRRHALYPKTTIDDLAEERARILGEYEQEPERLQFMIPTPEDFEQIVAIDSALFPEETWISAEALQKRLPYNPEVTHVLKDTKTNTVLGYISISPLRQDILEKLIALQIDETELKPEHFIPYLTNTPLDCYVVSVGARVGVGIAQHFYAGKLVYAVKNYLMALLEKGIIVRRIYAVATSREGERLTQSLSFTPLATTEKWQSAYADFRHPYVLDLEDKNSQSKMVKEYQKRKANRERRLKRYTKQARRESPF
jgi:predicted DNA-binding transcriptional regulator AlpA